MKNDDLIVRDSVARVLDAARSDWVQLVELQGYLLDAAEACAVELWHPSETASAGFGEGRNDSQFERRVTLGMRVVGELLDGGQIVPGEISDRFQPWAGSREEWQSRIEAGWRQYGTGANLNDVCWFALIEDEAPVQGRALVVAGYRVEWIKYFATVPERYVREWPVGLMRRTKLVDVDRTNDEACTSNDRWERTLYLIAPELGSSDAGFPLIEVPEAEAELIRQTMGDPRPRGGPFTPAGQAWLAAHPDGRAAKYLGVTPPVYDVAGRLVTPMGPVTGERASS